MRFTRSQQFGVLILCVSIVILQLLYFFYFFIPKTVDIPENKEWVALQEKVNQLKQKTTQKKDSIYPFNPNFITDYKGYKLGMSIAEIDRLHQFRAQNKWVNSVEDFKKVTQVSDSLLQKIAPYFKFPDWVKNRNQSSFTSAQKIIQTDINQVNQEELIAVSGIGEVLSERILQQKEQLGGFVSMEQLAWVFGISPQVHQKLQDRFVVKQKPTVLKLNINEANLKELASFPYFNYEIARNIITYRTMQGNEIRAEDLHKIKNFPTEKLAVITLYLQF